MRTSISPPPAIVDAGRAKVHLRKHLQRHLGAHFSTHPMHPIKEGGVEIHEGCRAVGRFFPLGSRRLTQTSLFVLPTEPLMNQAFLDASNLDPSQSSPSTILRLGIRQRHPSGLTAQLTTQYPPPPPSPPGGGAMASTPRGHSPPRFQICSPSPVGSTSGESQVPTAAGRERHSCGVQAWLCQGRVLQGMPPLWASQENSQVWGFLGQVSHLTLHSCPNYTSRSDG